MTDRHLVVFAATASLVYATVPFRVGDVYPLCRFAMFSQHTTHDSRLVLRDDAGGLHDVRDFDAFSCQQPVDPVGSLEATADPRCGSEAPHASYNEKHGALYIGGHPAPAGADAVGWAPMTVERQLVSFPEPYGPARQLFCPVGRCLVSGGR